MNRADAMLKVLRSSGGLEPTWWPRHLIFSRADRFFLTNNAASELRARGYDVEHRVIKGKSHYRLLSDSRSVPSPAIAEQALPGETERLSPHLTVDSLAESGATDGPPPVFSGQLTLVEA